MKIDFDQQLCDLWGVPMQLGGAPLTLKRAVGEALQAGYPDENISGDEKTERYDLAKRIVNGLDELTPAEKSVVITMVGKFFYTFVVGPAKDAINGTVKGPAPKKGVA